MPPKITLFQFKTAMRKHGEYTKAQLDGLYLRYLAGDVAQCIADAINVTKEPAVPTKPKTERRNRLSDEVLSARACARKNGVYARKQEILLIIDAHKKPMSLDEISREMRLVPESVQVFLREMADEKLILVTKLRVGRFRKNLYSLAEVE